MIPLPGLEAFERNALNADRGWKGKHSLLYLCLRKRNRRDVCPAPPPVGMTPFPIPPSDDPPVILTITEGRRIPFPGLRHLSAKCPSEEVGKESILCLRRY
ncbi:hypothetical protein CEXT_466041 [Caerostris extrusa]|uniref:Uncharacterized protein n=1 Tax=Caerostris extrusa TaxID=172846 RepID=A0AAV4XVL7_CAEEX|nr:hypothetical protein CEXT_466041 [Caerostris extrusa]